MSPGAGAPAEGEQIAALVRRFGSVTVLNGHIHQIVQKVEGNIHVPHRPLHRLSAAAGGQWRRAGPLAVPPAELPGMLGVTMAVPRALVADRHHLGLGEDHETVCLPFAVVARRHRPPCRGCHRSLIKNFDFADGCHGYAGHHGDVEKSGRRAAYRGQRRWAVPSPALDQNDSYSFKFDKPGVYRYICSIHPKMRRR